MNYWKDLPTGKNPPKEIYAVIEVPKGSRNKYEYDKKLEAFILDRVLHSPFHYPGDYGLVPRTWYDDDDPLDVLVLVEEPSFTGCVMPVRPIGVMRMEDEKGIDDKLLAVPLGDPRLNVHKDVSDIAPHWISEIGHFFEDYKKLESGKWAKVKEWLGAKEALQVIEKGMRMYKERFGGE